MDVERRRRAQRIAELGDKRAKSKQDVLKHRIGSPQPWGRRLAFRPRWQCGGFWRSKEKCHIGTWPDGSEEEKSRRLHIRIRNLTKWVTFFSSSDQWNKFQPPRSLLPSSAEGISLKPTEDVTRMTVKEVPKPPKTVKKQQDEKKQLRSRGNQSQSSNQEKSEKREEADAETEADKSYGKENRPEERKYQLVLQRRNHGGFVRSLPTGAVESPPDKGGGAAVKRQDSDSIEGVGREWNG